MRRRSASAQSTPQLTQLSPAIRWLRDHRVSPQVIGDAFGTSNTHVRLLAHRAAHCTPKDSAANRRRPPIRPDDDWIVMSEARRLATDALADRIESVFAQHAAAYAFAVGVEGLRQLLPPLGYPSSVPLIRLKARICRHLAWFLGHCGHARRASAYAEEAIRLYRHTLRQTRSRTDVEAIGDVGLIAANVRLLAQRPHEALRLLQLVADVDARLGRKPGVEYHRQQATAMFQTGTDTDALVHLRRTDEAMDRDGRADVHRQLAVIMRRNLLAHRDAALAQQIIHDVESHFGVRGLEGIMARNWAVAAALCAEPSDEALAAQVEDVDIASTTFGHQATISHLLRLTPRLLLPSDLRTRWVRYALYVNAFSHT